MGRQHAGHYWNRDDHANPRRRPTAQVIMLTVSPDERDVEESICAGACGYLLKDAPVEQILAAIEAAAAGESHLSPRIAADILDRVRTDAGRSAVPDEARSELTEREREVLRMIAQGKENAQIADELFISVQTVKIHMFTCPPDRSR
jgi:DNA-binding NarL/FixJ family response regulator